MSELERRSYREGRAESDDARRIHGYAIVFGSLSLDVGGFREIIAPSAVDGLSNPATRKGASVFTDALRFTGNWPCAVAVNGKQRTVARSINRFHMLRSS
jgi:hypothetical protein